MTHRIYLLLLSFAVCLMYGCGNNTSQQTVDEEIAGEDSVNLRWGIDVDRYDVLDGTIKNGQILSKLLEEYGVGAKVAGELEKAPSEVFNAYKMIEEGDRIAVGVSGGKDSLTLLAVLTALRAYYPKHFELEAVTVDMGLGMDFSPVAALCDRLEIPYFCKQTEIAKIVFDYRQEKNPCSMCARMRRGAINDILVERGFNKVALGHHFDDAVETFLMSLFYEGRISCFEPMTYLSRTGITQIRPMLYIGEQAIANFAEREHLPVVENRCPADKHTKRQEVKELIAVLQKQYPDLKTKIFGSMQRFPLPQWGVEE